MKIRPVRTISRKPQLDARLDPVGWWDSSMEKAASSVSIYRQRLDVDCGWQVHPVFHVVPARASIETCSKRLVAVLRLRPAPSNGTEQPACGSFAVDSRSATCDDARRSVLRAASTRIVEGDDFAQVRRDRRARCAARSTSTDGFERLVRLAYAMNCARQATQSEAIDEILDGILRDCTPGTLGSTPSCEADEDTVRSSWRHRESGRNDLTTQ